MSWRVRLAAACVALGVACLQPQVDPQEPDPDPSDAGSGADAGEPDPKVTPAEVPPFLCSERFYAEAVRRAYRGVLWREADEGGLQGYVALIRAEGRAGLVRTLRALAESDEWKQNVGPGKTEEELLERMYVELLGRSVDSAGRGIYLPLLQQGKVADVAEALGTSDEFIEASLPFPDRSEEAVHAAVTRAYRGLLWRDPDADGLASRAEEVTRRGTPGWMSILAGIAGSSELDTNVRPAHSAKEQLGHLHQELLDRPADAAAEGAFLKLVEEGRMPRVAVCLGTYDELFDKIRPPVRRRGGLVRLCNRSTCDDDGAFFARGTTLFWGVWGLRHDRERLEQNLDFLARSGAIDYIRVLGHVGSDDPGDSWADRPVDPRWSDFDRLIAEFTDLAYDKYGLRVEWTLFGGIGFTPTAVERERLVDRFLEMSKGREHKIMMFEVANESWQNGFGGDTGVAELRALTRRMKDGTDVLVAASADDGSRLCTLYAGGVADLATVHLDRNISLSDGPWRPVRQPWGYPAEYPCQPGELPEVASNNEPIGPYASVAEDRDPLRLTMGAVVTGVANMPMYVLHTGPGIRGGGAADLARGRPANLWETENIDQILQGLSSLGSYLPGDVASWSRHNAHWSTHPFTSDVDTYVRAYAAVSGSRFVVAPIGIKGTTRFTARAGMKVEILDPISGAVVRTLDLEANDGFDLKGDAFVLRGEWK